MNYKKQPYLLILFLLTLWGVKPLIAQQDPMYTQYMFNTLSVNPAYAGSRGVLNATGLLRKQWVGLDGAPTTQTLSLHSPLPLNMGIGLSLGHDEIGPQKSTMLFADYSYTIKVSEKGKLAFGLKAGFNLHQVKFSRVALAEGDDITYSKDLKSGFKPNFGIGAYYHTDRWYLGVSTPKIIENDLNDKGLNLKSKEKRHYFFIAGVVFDIDDYIKFKPTILAKYTGGSPLGFDVSANFLFYDKLWVGAAYRWKEAISGILRLQLTNQLAIGYSYDFSTSQIREYNSGSHEIMISYDFIFNKNKILSPRYF